METKIFYSWLNKSFKKNLLDYIIFRKSDLII